MDKYSKLNLTYNRIKLTSNRILFRCFNKFIKFGLKRRNLIKLVEYVFNVLMIKIEFQKNGHRKP